MKMPKTNETSPSSEHREEDRDEAQPLQARLAGRRPARPGRGYVGATSTLIGESRAGPRAGAEEGRCRDGASREPARR